MLPTLRGMENENQNYKENQTLKHADNNWFGMSPIVVLGIVAVILGVGFYTYNGGYASRVATTPMNPITTTSPTSPTVPPAPTTR
jgi:hypothetical protein